AEACSNREAALRPRHCADISLSIWRLGESRMRRRRSPCSKALVLSLPPHWQSARLFVLVDDPDEIGNDGFGAIVAFTGHLGADIDAANAVEKRFPADGLGVHHRIIHAAGTGHIETDNGRTTVGKNRLNGSG